MENEFKITAVIPVKGDSSRLKKIFCPLEILIC